jgi:flagellar export protein FliJ
MLRLLKVREENRLAAVRRLRAEGAQIGGVVGQLDHFAREYREQMVSRGLQGTTPAELMATLDFERKLSHTARNQQQLLSQIENNLAQATAQAAQARLRAQGVQKMLDRKRALLFEQRARAESREIEESVAARQMIAGMNAAEDPSS